MQPPAAGDLRGENPRHRGFADVEHDLVGQHGRRVQYARRLQPGVLDRGDQALGDSGLGDVAGENFDPAAVGGHLGDRRTDLVGGTRTAVEDNQSRALPDQPLREDETQATHATDNDVSAVTADRWLRRQGRDGLDTAVGRYRNDDLARVASRGHQPEGIDRVFEGELGDRKHSQLTVADTRKNL